MKFTSLLKTKMAILKKRLARQIREKTNTDIKGERKVSRGKEGGS